MASSSAKVTRRTPLRKKSCAPCRTSKVRCDLLPNGCSRCLVKGLECQYPGRSAASAIINLTADPAAAVPLPAGCTSTYDDISLGVLDGPALDLDLCGDMFTLETPLLEEQQQHHHHQYSQQQPTPESETADAISQLLYRPRNYYPPPLCPSSTTSTDIIVGHFEPPWMPEHFCYTRFVERPAYPRFTGPMPLTESLMTITLRSYANMMTLDSLPPFIHPRHREHPILANCVGLVALWRTQRKFNHQFVQGRLDRERSRLFAEYRSYSEQDILAAMQAINVYAILEYCDPHAEPGQLSAGYSHLASLLEMSYYMARAGVICHSEITGGRPSWEDWLTVESRRRILLVQFILDTLGELHHGRRVTVCPEVAQMPLPASKSLWEAPDRATWEREFDKKVCRQATSEQPKQLREIWGLGPHDERLDEWIAEMDVLGSAVLSISMCAGSTAVVL